MQETELKKDWSLTPGAFHRLLNWLDAGASSGGQSYLEMRYRLVGYFDRRNCLTPEELADETLTRIARRLEEEGVIQSETPAKYCYIVARLIFLEGLRRSQKNKLLIEQLQQQTSATDRGLINRLRLKTGNVPEVEVGGMAKRLRDMAPGRVSLLPNVRFPECLYKGGRVYVAVPCP